MKQLVGLHSLFFSSHHFRLVYFRLVYFRPPTPLSHAPKINHSTTHGKKSLTTLLPSIPSNYPFVLGRRSPRSRPPTYDLATAVGIAYDLQSRRHRNPFLPPRLLSSLCPRSRWRLQSRRGGDLERRQHCWISSTPTQSILVPEALLLDRPRATPPPHRLLLPSPTACSRPRHPLVCGL